MKKLLAFSLLIFAAFSPAYAHLVDMDYEQKKVDAIAAISALLQEQDKNLDPSEDALNNYRNISKVCFELYYDGKLGLEENVENLLKYTDSLKEFAKETPDNFEALTEYYSESNKPKKAAFIDDSPLEKVLPIMLDFADFYYAKTGNAKDAYFRLLQNYKFRQNFPQRHSELVERLAENPQENAVLVFEVCVNVRNFDLAIKMLDYLKADDIKGRYFSSLFAVPLRNGDMEMLGKLFKSKAFLAILEEMERKRMSALSFYLAFFKFYGYCTLKDENEANEILEKYAKLPSTSIYANDHDTYQVALSKLEGGAAFYLSLATKLKERGLPEFYINFSRPNAPSKKFAKLVELYYGNALKSDKEIFLPHLVSDFKKLYNAGESTAKLEKIAFDYISKELEKGEVYNRNIYYNLLLKGYGNDKDKEKIFNALNDFCIEQPTLICEKDILAFCYENGMGTPKDEAKAKSLRLEIEDSLKDKEPMQKLVSYMGLAYNYNTDKLGIGAIDAPELYEYYNAKIKENYPTKESTK